MKKGQQIFRDAAFLLLSAALAGCMASAQLTPSPAEPASVTGTYTLLLYGCHYPDSPANVAFLVSDSSKYPFEIYDIDTSYKTIRGVTGPQAIKEADCFLRCTTHRIWQTQLLRIPDGSGGTIGYELRPLYFPLEFGEPDVMLISYSLRDGRVRAYIRLDPDVERAILTPGGDESSHDRK